MGFSDASENEQSRGNKKLPSVAVTSLCEIKFNRKDVNAMNTLMCRRLVSALYQVYAEHCVMADREGRQRVSEARIYLRRVRPCAVEVGGATA